MDTSDGTKNQISQSLDLLHEIIGDDLLAVYLYGSSVMGGLHNNSDIDLFVLSDRQTTKTEKTLLISKLLKISGMYLTNKDFRPIELTIVVKSEVNPWHYPPSFDFQYGEWWRKEFEVGNNDPWPSKTTPDLTLQIAQVLLASKTLFGQEPYQLLDKVPYRDFTRASAKKIDSLMADLISDTRNVLLTFARVWCTLETDTIRSKPDAASWVIDKLPDTYKLILEQARSGYLGEQPENWERIPALLQPCAKYMVAKIKDIASEIETAEPSTRSIKLFQK